MDTGRGAERPARLRGLRWAAAVRVSKIGKISKILNFANFWRARSRLYQNGILQENMRSTAFFSCDIVVGSWVGISQVKIKSV